MFQSMGTQPERKQLIQQATNPVEHQDSDASPEVKLLETLTLETHVENAAEQLLEKLGDSNQNESSTKSIYRLLDKLQNEGIAFLRNISRELSRYPKRVNDSFRDQYILNKSEAYQKKFERRFKKFNTLNASRYYSSPSSQADPEQLRKAQKKANTIFNGLFKNIQKLLILIQGANWGLSSKATETVFRAQQFVSETLKQAVMLERDDREIITLVETLEKMSHKDGINRHYREVDDSISTASSYLSEKHLKNIGVTDLTAELIETTFNNSPSLICSFLYRNRSVSEGVKSELFTKQVERLRKQYPNAGVFSQTVDLVLGEKAARSPEQYIFESETSSYLFQALKQRFLACPNRSSQLIEKACYFPEQLKSLSPDETMLAIRSLSRHDFSNLEVQLLFASLSLTSEHYERIHKEYCGHDLDIAFSNEAFVELSEKRKEGGMCIPLFNYKYFNLTPAKRIEMFKTIVKNVSRSNSLKFLTSIFMKYTEVFDGIDDSEISETMNELINDAISGDFSEFDTLCIVAERCNIPLEYRNALPRVFASKQTSEDLKTLFAPTMGTTQETQPHFGKRLPELMNDLELEFYQKANETDLRHLFYEVLSGQRRAANLDRLVTAYADKLWRLRPEEFIDLFITGKKLDRKYAKFFAPRLDSSNYQDFLNQIDEGVRLLNIEALDRDWALTQVTTFGSVNICLRALQKLYEEERINKDNKTVVFHDALTNAFDKAAKNDLDSNLNSFDSDFGHLWLSIKDDDDRRMVLSEFFNGAIIHPNLHDLVTKRINYLPEAFEDTREKDQYVDTLLKSTNANFIASVLQEYLDPDKASKSKLFAWINPERRRTFLNYALEFENINISSVFIRYLGTLDTTERTKFFKALIAKDDILQQAKPEEVVNFCILIVTYGVKPGFIDDNSEVIFSKLFSSKSMTGQILTEIVRNQEIRDFLLEQQAILGQYVHRCLDTTPLDTLSVLQNFRSDDDRVLLKPEYVKLLSSKLLGEATMNVGIYKAYTSSRQDSILLYMDRESFNENIKRTAADADTVSTVAKREGLIEFLIIQRKQRIKNPDSISCSKDQEKKLFKRLVASSQNPLNANQLEKLWALDPEISEQALNESINERELYTDGIVALLQTKEDAFSTSSAEIVRYCFDSKIQIHKVFVLLCKRYGNNPLLLKAIKTSLYGLQDSHLKNDLKLELLNLDLLDATELRETFQNLRSQENVRFQVLSCAEVFGSFIAIGGSENITKFFQENNETVKESVEFIRAFVDEHPIENKGRTIAVMLFAKEYLPDRTIEEIVEKVAARLKKYKQVLDKFRYNGIPKNSHPSIAMEYEITTSTAQGYNELTGNILKSDIARLSKAAHIGQGRDAVHEIATRPAINPYLFLLEIELLNELEYVDFNFDRIVTVKKTDENGKPVLENSHAYQRGARGYHLNIGGRKGLKVNANTYFLQNLLVASSWAGINAGKTGQRITGGRGVVLRGRDNDHNVQVFENLSPSVELRATSLDKLEPFQRTTVTTFHGAIAIQTLEEYTHITTELTSEVEANNPKNEEELIDILGRRGYMKKGVDDQKVKKILYAWWKLVKKAKQSIEYLNNDSFLEFETNGYLDDHSTWVDATEFGGEYNRKRFESVVVSEDPTTSLEAYVRSLQTTTFNDFFSSLSQNMSDTFTKLNNMYLKRSQAGDQANAISMLQVTKLNNTTLERRDEPAYLRGTVFTTGGERRRGYYNVQGASERMLTHAIQKALLEFNEEIEAIVN